MDDSDDYFQDSFDLDENDLAFLAAEEAKYFESISAQAPHSHPPQKRRKVSHQPGSDDILDVFLQPDGSYGVATHMRQDEEGDVPVPKSLLARESQATERPFQTTMPVDTRISQGFGEHTALHTLSLNEADILSGEAIVPNVPDVTAEPTIQHTQVISRPGLEGELAALKATLDMLKIENDKVKTALQDAETSRFAKEGEVTILRKKVEKAAQQHAEDLVKLKEAKEAASLEQSKIQKEMKQQMERLRTEYIFKQHEIELSTRKPIWSSRSKRMALGSQMSPVPVPPAMRDWNTYNVFGSSKNNLLDTPSRRRQQDRTRLELGAKSRAVISELKFPGYENSFLPSSPLNSPSRPRQSAEARGNAYGVRTPKKDGNGRGKELTPTRGKRGVLSPVKMPALTLRPPAEPVDGDVPMDDNIQDFDVDLAVNDGSPRGRSKSLREESSPNRGSDSVGNLDFSDEGDREFTGEEYTFEGIDWSEELHYMLFSHACSVSKMLTFHFLLSVDIPNQDYQQSCSSILEALGMKYKFASLPKLMEAIVEKFVTMANILWEFEHSRHLQALFDLLSSTMAYIPLFTPAVLQAGFNEQNADHNLPHVISDIALNSLDGKRSDRRDQDSFTPLIHSMLTFLEMIAWTMPKELCSCLVPLLQSDQVLLTLLDSKQYSHVISHTIVSLVVLASHPLLAQALVSFPSEEHRKQLTNGNASQPLRAPVLERLSSLLVDPTPLSHESVDEALSSLLDLFSLLLAESPEGKIALLRSNTLVPCLIHYLSRLSTTLWEDDEHIMQSVDHAKSTVRNTAQALRLLHRLVVPTASDDQNATEFDFRQKLFYAPHTMFNGLTHMFVVMIGRLSYADPPDWLDVGLQAEIEKLTEPARDLMDLIIEGPEGDSVWVAYQDAEDESVTENDDEVEARMLDADGHD